MRKKISVIIATYNGANTIAATIESILNQKDINSTFDLELIVVDDCSTDNTTKIVQAYAIKTASTGQNSGGPNKGRNIGLRMVTGDYISITDQDDIWEPNRIATILPYLEKAPIVTSGYTIIDYFTNKEVNKVNRLTESIIYYPKNVTFKDKLERNKNAQNTYLGSIIYSAKLKEIFFEEIFGVVDYDWILRLFEGQNSIEIQKPLYKRIVRESNLSLNAGYRAKDFYYSLYFIEKYADTYPKLVKRANKRIHGSRARYYYLIGDMKNARMYFLRSSIGLKAVFYIITSYFGHKLVIKHFDVFG